MKMIEIGKTGILVSPICVGAMYFGSKTELELSVSILNKFLQVGGNFIDTANIYAHWIDGCRGGDSEEFLGGWIKTERIRDKIVIATKVGIEYPGTDRGLKSNQIKNECEKSLKRLGTDYIDIYYSHADDKNTPLEETLKAFNELLEEGKVRAFGASNYSAERLKESLEISVKNNIAEFCCIQQRHSYLKPGKDFKLDTQIVADESLFDLCRKNELQLLAYSPLLSGTYSRHSAEFPQFYGTKKNKKRFDILKEISDEEGISINQLVLAWMLNSELFVMPVIGVSSVQQLEENLKASEIRLTEERIKLLNKHFDEN
ncbi:MAG TPA: aldo/keto reductase [Ignavibacteriaceae bacterium]|nr:aldo/keto reductase [Ignavibacteriaceae bacterium]